jgi:8-oxo-dGTP pyrophosphatase MutT (NUDIX family)/phosphohistidine phosphatase SixA
VTLSVQRTGLAGHDVLAAGAVLWRAGSGGAELALVHRPRYDDWSFPKGKLDAGEAMPFAAVREVAEETGYRSRLGPLLGDARYLVPEGSKLVRYWAAEAREGTFVPNDETDELRWVPPAGAAALLSYQRDHEVLRRFTEIGPPHSVLLLVRHAKAGNRRQWEGDDALRPLSRTGREQARHLTELLPLFGPDRILSAPPVRCRESVVGTAARLGLPVREEPLLGDAGHEQDPQGALARLHELAAHPGVTLVSSQGTTIPALLGILVAEHPVVGVDPDAVPSRKASTWVLTFGVDGLRSADYYPTPIAH